jgi:hypothetical protein
MVSVYSFRKIIPLFRCFSIIRKIEYHIKQIHVSSIDYLECRTLSKDCLGMYKLTTHIFTINMFVEIKQIIASVRLFEENVGQTMGSLTILYLV